MHEQTICLLVINLKNRNRKQINMQPKWLYWAKQLQAIAQTGIEFTENPYDRERYERLRELSVEILNEYTGIDNTKIATLFANESGYQTPKVDVRAAIFNEKEEVLMIREKLDNKWALPGGWADIELSLRENILKESMEEAGAEIKIKRIVGIFDRNRHVDDDFPYSAYKVFVECDFIKSDFTENIETLEHGFFTMDTLPELSEGRNTRHQIDHCFAARRLDHFEAVFD
jgi:ADP-ribose pyrophosphatase YjhB (NUDIX family)